jgi:energy-coupling factor transporter transmembrane protein EcfT
MKDVLKFLQMLIFIVALVVVGVVLGVIGACVFGVVGILGFIFLFLYLPVYFITGQYKKDNLIDLLLEPIESEDDKEDEDNNEHKGATVDDCR